MRKTCLIFLLLSISSSWLMGQSKIGNDSIVVNLKVSFVIIKNGEVTKLKIVESDCKRCDRKTVKQVEQEVVRVIKATPAFGSSNDNSKRPTNQKYLLPLKIILRNDN